VASQFKLIGLSNKLVLSGISVIILSPLLLQIYVYAIIEWYTKKNVLPFRRNLTASGPRPNPQGSYHYGLINTTRTIRLQNSAPIINGKQRYAVNSVSFIPSDTPLKLADYFKIQGVFSLGSISDNPTGGGAYLQTSVMAADFRAYVEVVFENPEDSVQSWHIDGHHFFVVG
jgi:hypothetical protein